MPQLRSAKTCVSGTGETSHNGGKAHSAVALPAQDTLVLEFCVLPQRHCLMTRFHRFFTILGIHTSQRLQTLWTPAALRFSLHSHEINSTYTYTYRKNFLDFPHLELKVVIFTCFHIFFCVVCYFLIFQIFLQNQFLFHIAALQRLYSTKGV